MSNKSPFEIRFELLQLAQGILQDRNWSERQRLEQDWHVDREVFLSNVAKSAGGTLAPYPTLPSITTEEILNEAKKLNEFVSNG